MKKVDLSSFNNSEYHSGSAIKKLIWYFINLIFFNSGLFPVFSLKVFLLRLFGAKIGKGVVIKPYVNIKYPWFLTMGNYSWIGENVWIDNLGTTVIGDNVVVSQGAFLLTGNHDFTKTSFDLIVKGIIIEDGAWIGAKSVVCPGIRCMEHSILTVGSVANHDLEAFGIYRGNPAVKIKDRILE